jgi:aryl-alcohol dehydrogenase-like predicted oxidoreductase
MKYVKLAPFLPDSSRLGFGCSSFMGRVGRSDSLRAIGAALDTGITHFDVARLYGYGEAEALLGEALRGRRDRLVIASKFGLAAARPAAALRGLKPLARALIAAVPGLRSALRAALGATAAAPDRFSVAAARLSLEASLRALATDYIDIFFLHDCGPGDLGDELESFLAAQRAAGKIRAYGAASDALTIGRMMGRFGNRMIYQFGNSLGSPSPRLPAIGSKLITYSPFAAAAPLFSLLEARPELFCLPDGRQLRAADIYPLMLTWALGALDVGVVLCSMTDPEHLRRNVSVLDNPAFGEAELSSVAAAIGDALRRD